MIQVSSQQLLQIFPQSDSAGKEYSISSVVIDSRHSCKGCLFVAIQGEHFDGHQFIQKAVEKGAVAVIVNRLIAEISVPQIVVEDTRQALARLANFWRKQINSLVIAITGSNGKTTVKEMLGRILNNHAPTLMTAGNFNNDIGVPLTLFRLSENDRFAVIEMGANHRHEISRLLDIAEPDVVYVNNARAAHIEGFGSLQAVIEAKGEMYKNCKNSALAVFNGDESSSDYWKSISSTEKQFTFSAKSPTDLTGTAQQSAQGLQLTVEYQKQKSDCELKVSGEHNAQNALAAISLAIVSGLTVEQACHHLNGFSGVKGRQQFIAGVNESLIIDDSYNANPDSLAAAVKVLCALDGTPWLALGDMAEMGEHSLQLHQQAAIDAKETGVKQFFALGEMSCLAADVFDDNGFCFKKHDEMAEFLGTRLHKNINLLVKGSRSAGMEKIVEKLVVTADAEGVNHAL